MRIGQLGTGLPPEVLEGMVDEKISVAHACGALTPIMIDASPVDSELWADGAPTGTAMPARRAYRFDKTRLAGTRRRRDAVWK